MALFAAKNFGNSGCPIAFGEPRAKQSQDDKPLTHQESVRTTSVDYSLWSHLSLRSRRGIGVSATWPQLARLSPARSIPARPFGLGSRFDEAPSGSAFAHLSSPHARSIEPTREDGRSLACSETGRNGITTHPTRAG